MSEAQDYIDELARRRGYAFRLHKILAGADLDLLKAMDGMVSQAYLTERRLDKRTKELLFILSLTVMRAPHTQIVTHIKLALAAGATPEEILEAIEIALPEAGIVAFQGGVQAWAEVVGAPEIEPRAD
ncbi:carboxymuconolactone decarboxylase family protein [Amycolatopsis viridis]|uniref:4-carboxymuconolactone decarboxylase n=1 Tax=Amycolatopsis viridis TaxID=185678 RepID=A0ABX0SWK9_9PSEU|nr:carboxymuconolactone decarboxylase family protein [Amycolatopsis viridis]NIH80302.1 4-carboxymuconolactone decarboxylase [Amycolatopsis viridis]